jgi:RNA recognition motif-containing protein
MISIALKPGQRESIMNIYTGNLTFSLTEDDLRNAFEVYGEVENVRIITDYNGRSKGFGFVDMPNEDEAKAAIIALNDTELAGRNLRVNEARPREQR